MRYCPCSSEITLRTFSISAGLVASTVTSAIGADDLASAVAARLRESGSVTGHKVDVKAKAGTVILEGQVGDAGQIAAAEEAAALLARTELLHEELLQRWQQQKEQSAELQEQRRQQLERSIREGQPRRADSLRLGRSPSVDSAS